MDLPQELLADLKICSVGLPEPKKSFLLGVADGLHFSRFEAALAENRGSRIDTEPGNRPADDDSAAS